MPANARLNRVDGLSKRGEISIRYRRQQTDQTPARKLSRRGFSHWR